MLNTALLALKPAWVYPGVSLDMDFTNGRAWLAGFKAWPDILSTTRAQTVNSYALNTSGVMIPFGANTPRVVDGNGLLVEEARTNKQLWSNDWTNAAYVKVTMTAALDQIGPDGVTNSASSLTATGNGATILQTVTEVATSNTASVWLKRITGSGAVTLVQNGVSGTTCSLNTTSWTLNQVTATQLNPAIGFIMATSGDKIAVWGGQFELGAFATSPIPTTTVAVARAADVVSLTGAASAASVAARAARFETNLGEGITTAAMLVNYGGTQAAQFNSTTVVRATNGTNNADATIGGAGTYSGLVKAALGFDAASITSVANGGTLASTANAWGAPSGTVYIGGNSAGTRQLNGYLRRATFGLTKSQFDGLTV